MNCVSEKRQGLRSTLTFVCRMCGLKAPIDTDSPRPEQVNGMYVNTATISGIMSIGCGFSNLCESLASLNVPAMSSHTYSKEQEDPSGVIDKVAWEELKKAGAEEARLARESGDVDNNGLPTITVVVPGAWCKRSYKNKYDASSGAVSNMSENKLSCWFSC
ncbi:hypothetical protein HPB48_009083 [Haemaphysalis longicornis]|uniref:Mutator-like transposase domain-containing protein n=1 Tax=Haemaphysalis longicornis TaxID=44386 RepID=A0A9J6FYV8_HAELO|nr:hypothetical protein HPB48_009083 [Haemaphysalis longicornis]